MWYLQSIGGKLKVKLRSNCIVFFSKKCKHVIHNTIKSTLDSCQIFEIVSKEQCQAACSLLNSHCWELPALGFHCEWITKNGVQRPVALLQLASCQGLSCLFRLNMLQSVPSDLESILSDKRIIKLGISPLTDKKFLKNDYEVKVCGTLDLRHLYPNSRGLATLAQAVLGMKINRLSKLQCCNWENVELTLEQKEFAAKDGLVAIKIFQKWLLDHTDISSIESEGKIYESAYKHLEKIVMKHLDVPFRYV